MCSTVAACNLLLCTVASLLLSTTSTAATTQQHSRGQRVNPHNLYPQQQALQQHVQSLLEKCPLPGYCVRDAGLPTAAEYLREPDYGPMKQQKQKIAEFIAGSGFQARLHQIRSSQDERGILISAGKPHHVGTTTIMLHALRNVHNCRLPVEIAYRGDSEVDPTTRQTLSAAFAPLHWLDLDQQQYPDHHNKDYAFDRYEPKIYALYHTRFKKVLLLDADNMPLRDPSHLFHSPHVRAHGVMMWTDLWSPLLSSTTFTGHDTVYPLIGLNKQAYWTMLSGGSGYINRVAESGQLVLDRERHADVLEYLWWITSYSKVVYRHLLGDKDTFGYAFAAAGKLHEYSAIAIPAGAAFRLKDPEQQQQQQQQQLGGTAVVTDKVWRFMGMLQYDHLGTPAFFHRTFEKWEDVTSPPHHIDVITGPLPNWFIMSYLGNKTTGLTPEIPQHTLEPMHITTCSSSSSTVQYPGPVSTYISQHSNPARAVSSVDSVMLGRCPIGLYVDYVRLRDWGLPVRKQPRLLRACRRLASAAAAAAAGSGGSSVDGGATDSSSSSNSSELWPQMSEHVWFRSCRELRQQQQQLGGSSNDGLFMKLITDRLLLQDQQQQAGTGAAADSLNSGSSRLQMNLPRCELIDWHVARYMLPEYAEVVAKDTAGHPTPVVDSNLPVLQLLPAAAAAAAAAGQQQQMCGDLGFISVLDEMQMRSIPAAMQWVMDNLQALPILQKRQ